MSLDVRLHLPEGTTGVNIITHNLKEMAIAAGFGKELWRQEETDIHFASDLIEILAVGGGYIVASSHDIHQLIPVENFYAMRDAVQG